MAVLGDGRIVTGGFEGTVKIWQISKDPAQAADAAQVNGKDLGGVDLSMNKDNFELKAGAGNAPQIAQFNIDPDAIKGLVPVIISITPAGWPEALRILH